MPAAEVLACLRGKTSIDLGEFESREARLLARDCRKHGLVVQEQVIDRSGCTPFNEKTNACLVIENDTLRKQVCEEALKRGVSVRHLEA